MALRSKFGVKVSLGLETQDGWSLPEATFSMRELLHTERDGEPRLVADVVFKKRGQKAQTIEYDVVAGEFQSPIPIYYDPQVFEQITSKVAAAAGVAVPKPTRR